MNDKMFNKKCAELLGIYYSDNADVFVTHENEGSPREFNPCYDANDRNMVISYLKIDTQLLTSMEFPEWQCVYGKGDIDRIIIETGVSIEDAQRECIAMVMIDSTISKG